MVNINPVESCRDSTTACNVDSVKGHPLLRHSTNLDSGKDVSQYTHGKFSAYNRQEGISEEALPYVWEDHVESAGINQDHFGKGEGKSPNDSNSPQGSNGVITKGSGTMEDHLGKNLLSRGKGQGNLKVNGIGKESGEMEKGKQSKGKEKSSSNST